MWEEQKRSHYARVRREVNKALSTRQQRRLMMKPGLQDRGEGGAAMKHKPATKLPWVVVDALEDRRLYL